MRIMSDEEAVIMISMSLNFLFIVFAYDYLKEYKKFRERISRFRTKVKQLIKKNKVRYDIELQKATMQIKHEFDEHLRKEEDLRISTQQLEKQTKKDMIELQQKVERVLSIIIEKNKNCIESNYRTLQALKSKYVRVFDLENERCNLNEKSKQKLLEHFEEFEKKIKKEIQSSEISQQIIEKAFSEIKQKIR
jgi:hypothetical protein